jgi:hypothetical protein
MFCARKSGEYKRAVGRKWWWNGEIENLHLGTILGGAEPGVRAQQ